MRKHRWIAFCVPLLVVLSMGHAQTQNLRLLVDLEGDWKFELGDDSQWTNPAYDDSRWDIIYVPASWEDEGYPGYDGYAWYRTHFRIDNRYRDRAMYLRLGYVDDVSEVYLNGHMIGFAGKFPPDFFTGAAVNQQHPVNPEYLRYDSDNILSVRVYDHFQAGGIKRGDIGLYESLDELRPDFSLAGKWKFRTGDDESWRESSYDDSKWVELTVPGYWEIQGFRNYDGYAWYRTKFRVPKNLEGERLILLLGRIDDVDEVYLNGERIGGTGNMRRDMGNDELTGDWLQLRAYTIPSYLLAPNGENTIAVRVLDVWMHGGIYDAPVGLVERDRYLDWTERPRTFWDVLRRIFR